MSKIVRITVPVTVELDLDDYAAEYGVTVGQAEDEGPGHVSGLVGEVVDDKARQMGYFTAYVTDYVTGPR